MTTVNQRGQQEAYHGITGVTKPFSSISAVRSTTYIEVRSSLNLREGT